jgi:flavodoxin
MARAFIVFETRYGSTEEAVRKMALMLGPARFCRISTFKPEFKDNYDFYVLGAGVYNEYIDGRLTAFVNTNLDWLKTKRVALFSTCLSGTRGLHYVEPLAKTLGGCVVCTGVVDGKFKKDQLTPEDFAIMKGFYESIKQPFQDTDRTSLPKLTEFCLRMKAIKDGDGKAMPADRLKGHIEEFLRSYRTCVIATGSGDSVRSTPVTYWYRDGHIYIVSEGGRKFTNIIANRNISVTVYDPSPDGRAGMQLTGTVTVVTPEDSGYRKLLQACGLDFQRITGLPWMMNGLDIKLSRAEFRWRQFDQMGFSRVQSYDFVV